MSLEQRHNRITKIDAMDAKFGFERYKDPTERLGWLINMHPVSIKHLPPSALRFLLTKEFDQAIFINKDHSSISVK